MKGAQELREDTAQKMKTIALTEEESPQRKELRYEIWEAKVEQRKRITHTHSLRYTYYSSGGFKVEDAQPD